MPIPKTWFYLAATVVPEGGINSASELLRVFEFLIGLDPCVFRGEAEEFETFFRPSIGRGNSLNQINGTNITQEEINEILRCQKDCENKNLKDPYLDAFLGEKISSEDVNWVPLAQHLRTYKTRLFDVTYNPLVGLYFATDPPELSDGIVFFIPKGSLRPQKKNPEIGIDIPSDFRKLYDGDIYNKTIPSDIGYLLEPELKNSNMIAQQGAFVWWKEPSKAYSRQVHAIKVKGKAKKDIRRVLEIFGINEDNLFPLNKR